MTNKEKRLLFILFTAFLIFGGFITIFPINSTIKLLDSSENRNSIHTENMFQENSIEPKSSDIHAPIYINGNDWTSCDIVTGSGLFNDPYIIADVIIDGGVYGIRISNSQSYGIIQNCTILNANIGIYIEDSSNCSITGNNVTSNLGHGIRLSSSSNCNITENNATDNSGNGIYLYSSSNCTFTGNRAFNNSENGIEITEYSSNCTVTGNNATNNLMNGIDISEYSGNSAVNGNIAINNTVAGIVVGKYSGNSTVNGNIAINNLAHGIALGQNSGNSTVNGNIATNNSRTGIALSSSNCTLTGNNVSNNSEYGIRLWHAGGNIVTGNNVTFNSMNGIYLMYSADCNVTANTVVNNPNYGINIYWSPDCSVIGNIVSNNSDDGIYIHAKSHNCILTGNVVTNNSGEGIYIYDDISNCTVTGNNITNNAYNGIYLEITSNCTLIGNNISNNLNYGIHTYSSWNCTLIGNNVSKNSGYGIFLGMFSSNCTVTGNWLIKNLGANFRNSGTNNLVYDNILINFLGVSFTASKSSILIGDIVSFTDTSTNGNPPLSYEWEFGDGTTSTLQNPSHSYSVAGIYAVSLNVTDSDGDFAIYNMDITVNEDLLPDASFTVLSTTVIVDNVVSFTDTSTEGNPPLSYEWEFGDGTTSTLQNPTHSYSVVGIYTVLLNVTDSDGDFAIYNMDITVIEDLQPSASFTVLHSTVYVSDIVSFTDASTGGNSPLSYTWIFGDGTTSTLQNPTHSYSAAGIYSVSLNVTDINGDSAISSTSITVIQDIQPSASFTVLHSTVYVDDVVSFTDTSTGGNSPLSYTWDFGDGTTSILQNPTHSYSSAGIYYVSLTVTDSDGDSHSSNLDMVVISTNDSTIPSYSIGILLFSVGVTVIIILKRKSIKS